MDMVMDEQNGVLHVSVSGSMDFNATNELGQRFTDIASEGRRMVIDLQNLEYLSSIGIRTLLSTARTAVANGGKLVLLNPNDLVRTVLLTTGVDNVIPVVFDADEAQNAVRLPIKKSE